MPLVGYDIFFRNLIAFEKIGERDFFDFFDLVNNYLKQNERTRYRLTKILNP